jgi:hypothetical protein
VSGELVTGGLLACGPLGKVALEVSGTLLVELAERLADSGPPVLTPRPIGRELVATAFLETLVLLCVLAFCLGEDLVGELAAGAVRPRRRNRARVAWSRSWFAPTTRKATSSTSRRSMRLEERSPTQ